MPDEQRRTRIAQVQQQLIFYDNTGSSPLWLIVAGFVALIIAGPLASAAIDIQQSLASNPGISSLQASLFALFVVAIVILAIFGQNN